MIVCDADNYKGLRKSPQFPSDTTTLDFLSSLKVKRLTALSSTDQPWAASHSTTGFQS